MASKENTEILKIFKQLQEIHPDWRDGILMAMAEDMHANMSDYSEDDDE